MLGRRRTLDTTEAEKRAISRQVLKIERDLRVEIARLRERLDETVRDLGIMPERVERVVRVALELARQPQLVERMLRRKDGTIVRVLDLPPLTGSWARCSDGLPHPVTGNIRRGASAAGMRHGGSKACLRLLHCAFDDDRGWRYRARPRAFGYRAGSGSGQVSGGWG